MPNIVQRVNGKVCVVKNHLANAEIAGLTSNHWQYASRQGYDMLVMVEPWRVQSGLLGSLLKLLSQYETVCCLGSDVITNLDIGLETFFSLEHGAVVSTERLAGAQSTTTR